jgi:hypothetical protein
MLFLPCVVLLAKLPTALCCRIALHFAWSFVLRLVKRMFRV